MEVHGGHMPPNPSPARVMRIAEIRGEKIGMGGVPDHLGETIRIAY